MKRFLTAAAAVSLLAAGAAYAQTAPMGADTAQGGANMTPPAGSEAGSMPAQGGMTPDQGGSMAAPGAMAPDQGGSMPAENGAGMAGQGGMAAPAGSPGAMAEQADTPAPAPGAYPPCTSRGQDRCTQTAAMKASSRRAAHHMAPRHHRAAMKATSTSAPMTAEPASPQ